MRFINWRSEGVIYLFIIWKICLVIFATLPIPSGDAFFYDGPVVNYLLTEHYCNPSLAGVLPISGNEVFCAYPPFYQLILFGWMRVGGTSASSAVTFHTALVVLFAVAVLLIFRRLKIPAFCANIGGLFLFCLTSHDRPDTLAQLMAVTSLYFVLCDRNNLATLFLLLTFSTSLQIGGVYLFWIGLLSLMRCLLNNKKLPVKEGALLVISIVGLVGLVKFGYPHLWAGFQEHVAVTPAVTGLRLPHMDNLLRVDRVSPGVLLSASFLVVLFLRRKLTLSDAAKHLELPTAASGIAAALVLIVSSLVLFTPSNIHMVGYMQPIIVGCFLSAFSQSLSAHTDQKPRLTTSSLIPKTLGRLPFLYVCVYLLAALLVASRAIGMTFWGFACASDLGYEDAVKIVRKEIDELPSGSTVVVSSPFCYETARCSKVKLIHADWLGLTNGKVENPSCDKIVELKPAKLLLVSFDRYRRYDEVINQLFTRPEIQSITIITTANRPPPDAYLFIRRLFQNVSWSPVIVNIVWNKQND